MPFEILTLNPIPGYEGRYSASPDGRIYSHAKLSGRGRHQGRWLVYRVSDRGYAMVRLFSGDGRKRSISLHSLIAAAWIGPRPDGYDINHLDGVKTNNAVSNLEYCTRSRNMRHAVDTGLKRRLPGRRKLTPEQAAEVRKLAASGTMNTVIAKRFGLSKVAIGHIVNNLSYIL